MELRPTTPSYSATSVSLRNYRGSHVPISADSVGRLRVSNPYIVFENKQVDLESLNIIMGSTIDGAGSATFLSNSCGTRLLSSGVAGEITSRQSRRLFRYDPGIGNEVFISYNVEDAGTTGVAGCIYRVGLFNWTAGYFWQFTQGDAGTDWQCYVRTSSGTVIAVPKIDTLDGTKNTSNPSKLAFDVSKSQVLHISYEWLGVGGILFSFVIGNEIIPCAFIPWSNVNAGIIVNQPNLPIRWEVEGDSGSAQGSLLAISCAVIANGDYHNDGILRSDFHNADVLTSSLDDMVEILSIRLRCTGTTDADTLKSTATVLPNSVSMLNTGASHGLLLVCYNPTFATAGTWQDPIGLEGSKSHVQVCKSNRDVSSPGHIMHSEFFSAQTRVAEESFDRILALGSVPSNSSYGTSDVISLVHRNVSSAPTNTRGSFNWRELP